MVSPTICYNGHADQVHSTGLLLACTCGDAAELRRRLGLGADPNASIRDGMSALHIAIVDRKTELCQILMDAGADPNRQHPGIIPALHWAVARSWHDVVRLLLDRGADPNLRASDGQRAIEKAMAVMDTAMCSLLIDGGTHIDDGLRRSLANLVALRFEFRLAQQIIDCDGESDLQLALMATGAHDAGSYRSTALADFLRSHQLRRKLAAGLSALTALESEAIEPLPAG
jgi:ankyrin repeat protein